MYIVNPFYTIFKTNNWFYDKANNCINYSDDLITSNMCVLNIPFKNNVEYNKKLLEYFDTFIKNLSLIVDGSLKSYNFIKSNFTLTGNETLPVNIIFNKTSNDNIVKLSICSEVF